MKSLTSCLRCLLMMLMLALCANAQTGSVQRLALVIGNDAYANVRPLANARNDASLMAATLTKAGFDVTTASDLDRTAMWLTIDIFKGSIQKGDEIVFYFAGHGVQIKSNQLLLPVDIKASNNTQVQRDGIALVDVQDALKDARFALLVIDACRDNPFPQEGSRAIGDGTRGLMPPEPGTGQVIMMSAGRNQKALDYVPGQKQPNGLFTWELAQVIQTPGVEIRAALETVKNNVDDKAKSAGHQQRPSLVNDLRGNFYFFGPTTVQVNNSAAADPEAETWLAAKRAGTVDGYLKYRGMFPAGHYVGAADIELAILQKLVVTQPSKVMTVTSPVPSDDPETALWNEVKASGLRDYFAVYLKQYPKGKYLALAKMELGKLDDQDKAVRAKQENERKQAEEQAKAEQARAEQQAWNNAKAADTPESYTAFLNSYPQGRYAALAEVARQKVQREAASRERQAATETGKVVKDCDVCPEMVVIPAGSFNMGSNDGDSDEKPVHNVNISSFLMGKTEVTQGQWRSVMGSNPSIFKDCGEDCPVENVSWNNAQDYAQKLSQKTGKRYRLPSEAEWEYAARAVSQGKWSFGDSESELGNHAWYYSNSSSTTHKVGQKRVNAFGLYDMHGNDWEWVQDDYHDNYSGAPTNGSAWVTGSTLRVLRGGSWSIIPAYLRSAYRGRDAPVIRYDNTGLRLARTN